MRSKPAVWGLCVIAFWQAIGGPGGRRVMRTTPPASVRGRWTIKEILPTTNVQTSPKQWKKVLGLQADYLRTEMRFAKHVVRHPTYTLRTVPNVEFFKEFTIPLSELGIRGKSVVEVEVFDSKGRDPMIAGDDVFVRNANEVIADWDGHFFLLTRP